MNKRFLISFINKNNFLRKKFLNFSINLNNYSYFLIKKFIVEPGGLHPKHKIINYKKFFVDNVEENDKVLDVGCFRGEISFPLAGKVRKVVGIDIDGKKIGEAKKKNDLDNLEFIHGDATSYDFSELGVNKFDKIILSNVLEHIENRVDFLQKLKNLSDVIFLRVPMLDRDWLTVYKKENGYKYMLDPTHFIEYTQSSLEEELNNGGWKLLKYSRKFGEVLGIVIKK